VPERVCVMTLNGDAALIDYAKSIVAELRAPLSRLSPTVGGFGQAGGTFRYGTSGVTMRK